MTNLAAQMLADRGYLDVHAPIARYWPEYAANGKQDIEVRHLLGHTSGVSGWEQPFATEDMYDWEKSASRLAGQAPWWEPGCNGHGCARSVARILSAISLGGEVDGIRLLGPATIDLIFEEQVAR